MLATNCCSVHHLSLFLLSVTLDLCPFFLLPFLPFPADDDLRQMEGFKNVSLGNVLAVAYATQREKLTFLEEDDKVGIGIPKVRVGMACPADPGRQTVQCRGEERILLWSWLCHFPAALSLPGLGTWEPVSSAVTVEASLPPGVSQE